MAAAGSYDFELVAKPNELSLYVTGPEGASIGTAGAKAKATITQGRSKVVVPLEPANENSMAGRGAFRLSRDMMVMVLVTLPGKTPELIHFTPMKRSDTAMVQEMHRH